jgi:hypothetical protein
MTPKYQSHLPRRQRRPHHLHTIIPFLLLLVAPPTTNSQSQVQKLPSCWIPCANSYSGIEPIPSTNCAIYQVCFEGVVKNRVACGEGMLYNAKEKYCDYEWNVDCEEVTCAPTLSPSESPTEMPTDNPSAVSLDCVD